MRFTPDILRKHAQVLVEKETKKDRSIQAAYLRGSLLYGSPLIGGAGDIDLVFIHNFPPDQERQIRKLTPEIHFDIEHHDQILYKTPRELRLDPWLGPTLRDAVPLYDPRHVLDYTQSGVRSNFDFPENIQARSTHLVAEARQFWMDRQITPPQEVLSEIPAFLKALEQAVNSVALLSGPPLTIRRLGQDFPQRAEAVNAPGLSIAFTHLLGAVDLTKQTLTGWLGAWTDAMAALKETPEKQLYLVEQETYFLAALEKQLLSPQPLDGLWPMLNTWTAMVSGLPNRTELRAPWIKALTTLGFAGRDYQVRLAAFDGFLEMCETLIEKLTNSST
ncbi:MAG: hypothetical protein AB8I40_03670 [Anaerolineales bacterium]